MQRMEATYRYFLKVLHKGKRVQRHSSKEEIENFGLPVPLKGQYVITGINITLQTRKKTRKSSTFKCQKDLER